MKLLAGLDEVGRGSVAGPVVAAAVILKKNHQIFGLRDSKTLSSLRRSKLEKDIKNESIAWNVAIVSSKKIDKINILQSSLLAMKKAIEGLNIKPEFFLVDGLYLPKTNIPGRAIIKGDSKCESIMAASIVAKIYRDKLMIELSKKYKHYSFHLNKGYLTKVHLEAIKKYGPCKEHRISFRPFKTKEYK